MSQRYAICDPESGRFYPWWRNFVASQGDFSLGSSEFVQARDRALHSVGAKFIVDWANVPGPVMERYIEFQDDNAGLMFILKWS